MACKLTFILPFSKLKPVPALATHFILSVSIENDMKLIFYYGMQISHNKLPLGN